jgi:hypothetical protein
MEPTPPSATIPVPFFLALCLFVLAGQVGVCAYMTSARDIPYNPTISELNVSNVQAAIEALDRVSDGIIGQLDFRNPENLQAEMSGRNALTAEEVYYQDHDIYVNNLESLLRVNHDLSEDPQVTFTFYGANVEGFTFATSHYRGTLSYLWHE